MCKKHERAVKDYLLGLAKKYDANVEFLGENKHFKFVVKFKNSVRVGTFTTNTGRHSAGQFGCIKRDFESKIREMSQ